MLKVHMASTSGYWPCGATNPALTSDNDDEVTCHLCKKNRDWAVDNREAIDEHAAKWAWLHEPD